MLIGIFLNMNNKFKENVSRLCIMNIIVSVQENSMSDKKRK
jgi:hypothetical protein